MHVIGHNHKPIQPEVRDAGWKPLKLIDNHPPRIIQPYLVFDSLAEQTNLPLGADRDEVPPFLGTIV